MSKLFLKPAPGLLIPGPDGTNIPAGGMALPNERHWRQLRKAGDLVDMESAVVATVAAESKPATKARPVADTAKPKES